MRRTIALFSWRWLLWWPMQTISVTIYWVWKFLQSENHSLDWLMSFKQRQGQVMHWLEHHKEYDYEIQHWFENYISMLTLCPGGLGMDNTHYVSLLHSRWLQSLAHHRLGKTSAMEQMFGHLGW